jgi:hypothetical protein
VPCNQRSQPAYLSQQPSLLSLLYCVGIFTTPFYLAPNLAVLGVFGNSTVHKLGDTHMKNIMDIVGEFAPAHMVEAHVMSECFLHQDPMRIWMGEELEITDEHYSDVVFNVNDGRKTNNGFQITTNV